ncbi:unnamed protein product (mitochondrion) [Plasmodiophora brassicae]|uniref:Uncharacterized protein n=1 Tax=Plasmodiophora brassicae TaxID=37360 RepID=A0A3P3Y6W6_PLABS|nr:unnamed protein product [Plasmodiophora brassicae]SPQ95913.1 unnamed protein product [Plasmodiophora brassicae]
MNSLCQSLDRTHHKLREPNLAGHLVILTCSVLRDWNITSKLFINIVCRNKACDSSRMMIQKIDHSPRSVEEADLKAEVIVRFSYVLEERLSRPGQPSRLHNMLYACQ